ncbi:MAG TPA: restriction endonuclease [Planctomycetes bacterium]|nr:restriction endonuclease [Planctomycetota bacterium]
MPIPDYQDCMLPLLRLCSDGRPHVVRDTIETLAGEFKLTDDERRRPLPSGRQPVFENRVGWARTYMKKAGLLEAVKRGVCKITQRGLETLAKKPAKIDTDFLLQFKEFSDFRTFRREPSEEPASAEDARTPEEALDAAYEKLRDDLAADILDHLKTASPSFFERIVVEVVVRMGYGGSRQDAGQAIGRSGDGGLDGIIKEDKLGLDAIYIQAKRWENTVGRPEIQKFVGALTGERARKGIFITTSSFSQDALDYVAHIETKVVLIDGPMLAQLMIDHDVGVTTVATYDLKRVDSDYFAEE